MKTNIFKVFFKKEKIHWKRMIKLFRELTGIGERIISFPILVVLISIFHYAFALMHFLFESVMFFSNKEQYKHNIAVIDRNLIKVMKEI